MVGTFWSWGERRFSFGDADLRPNEDKKNPRLNFEVHFQASSQALC